MNPDLSRRSFDFTGTQVNYYFVCKRKLWLFSNDIRFENENEYVQLGRLVDETTYKRHKKQIEIGRIKIDFVDNQGVIHEVKKSNKVENAHIWQLKFYIHRLKTMGLENVRGELDYPKLKKRKTVSLDPGDDERFETLFKEIREILDQPKPPQPVRIPVCGKCAYYEFCYA